MSDRGSWAVVKDSLITEMRSGHEATVKQSLTVQVEVGRAATAEKYSIVQMRAIQRCEVSGVAIGKTGSETP